MSTSLTLTEITDKWIDVHHTGRHIGACRRGANGRWFPANLDQTTWADAPFFNGRDNLRDGGYRTPAEAAEHIGDVR